MTTHNDTAIAWFAGLFEGEGSTIFTGKTGCSITIQMTDLDILEKVHALFGGSLIETKTYQEHHKQTWRWSISKTQTACELLEKMLPYLGNRRKEKALAAIKRFEDRKEAQNGKAEFRELVRNLYASGDWTQHQLADHLGVSRGYICDTVRKKYEQSAIV